VPRVLVAGLAAGTSTRASSSRPAIISAYAERHEGLIIKPRAFARSKPAAAPA
jgi:hypothetical protein